MLLFISGGLKWVFLVMGFNTSHVTLYQGRSRKRGKEIPFQYISCYSLSIMRRRMQKPIQSFNTSHVTLYRSNSVSSNLLSNVSIHLMLLFIHCRCSCGSYAVCVSIHLMLLFIRKSTQPIKIFTLFQYISCYSLSWKSWAGTYRIWNVSIHLMLLFISFPHVSIFLLTPFQYISCYSLSVSSRPNCDHWKSFNTSHVTLYLAGKKKVEEETTFQYISCYSLSLSALSNALSIAGFNTSHVTLYLIKQFSIQNNNLVSIHLMLLFIAVFQCSSHSSGRVSIHLMLLFIMPQMPCGVP